MEHLNLNLKSSALKLQKLKEWQPDERILHKLRGTGFERLHELRHMNICINLVAVMMEHFVDHECIFQFGERKFCLSLEDVYHLTGLPIRGKAVTGEDIHFYELGNLYLGRTDLFCKNGSGRYTGLISCSTLYKEFKEIPENVSNEQLDRHVRAYVLYCIGCFICPSNSNDRVSTIYLSLMANVSEIGLYAWGAALLSYLYRGIQLLRAGKVNNGLLRGNALLIEVNICVN